MKAFIPMYGNGKSSKNVIHYSNLDTIYYLIIYAEAVGGLQCFPNFIPHDIHLTSWFLKYMTVCIYARIWKNFSVIMCLYAIRLCTLTCFCFIPFHFVTANNDSVYLLMYYAS